jgi:hypothetical protein
MFNLRESKKIPVARLAPLQPAQSDPGGVFGNGRNSDPVEGNYMQWRQELIERLAACVPGGYFPHGEAASEPTALAGMAMQANGDVNAARQAADWLVAHQSQDGSLGVTATMASPCWSTSLAILLWQAIGDADKYGGPQARAVAWALREQGKAEEQRSYVGHNTLLIGWSWAANTHSWLEPTAMFVLALKAAGQGQHRRTREAVRLLVDRLLPHGGCNYGNTIVLGQELLPHVQPTGMVMMALAGEPIADPRIEKSLQYLERELSANTTTSSLCYGLLGLTAHDRTPADRITWLESAYERIGRNNASTYKFALITLASTMDYPFTTQP